jgi:hypothetical protein
LWSPDAIAYPRSHAGVGDRPNAHQLITATLDLSRIPAPFI